MKPLTHHVAERVGTGWRTAVARTFAYVALSIAVLIVVGSGWARADVGELGPPPTDQDIRQSLADKYSAGQPLGSVIEVGFDGPVLVGQPTLHANPPPEPWCVRCGYPDQGVSLMYPVMALVTVKVRQDLVSSALGPANFVESSTTHNGSACPADPRAAICTAYYFYRDGNASWQIA